MREIVHMQAGQCGNQIGAKVSTCLLKTDFEDLRLFSHSINAVVNEV